MAQIKVGVVGAGGRMGRTVCARSPSTRRSSWLPLSIPQRSRRDHPRRHDLRRAEVARRCRMRGRRRLHRRRRGPRDRAMAGDARHPRCRRHDRLDRRRLATFRAEFTGSNCIIAANFAISAVLMMRFAELAAPYFDTRRDHRAAPRRQDRRAVGHRAGHRRQMAAASASGRRPDAARGLSGRPRRCGPGRDPRPLRADARAWSPTRR